MSAPESMSGTPAISAAGEQASTVEAADIAPASRWPWWAIGAMLFALALAGVLAWVVAANSGADRFGTTPPRTVNGAAFQLTHGSGRPEGTSFILESAQEGLASLSAEISPFQAEKYPRVEWDLRSLDPPGEIAFAWRTRENPRRTYSKPLFWLFDRMLPLRLDANEGWRGTITGVALVARGNMRAPLEVRSLNLPSASAGATLAETFTQWAAHFPFKGYTISFPFDAERAHFMPIAKAIAIACGLAIIGYVALARLRSRQVDWRVPWAIFAAGWILLDLRWQVNVALEVAAAAERFGGKTSEEKALARDDAPLVALAQELRRALPPPPARVLVLCDNGVIALRVAHFLFPYNVSRNRSARNEERERGTMPAPSPATLRSGDNVVLLFYSGLRYDADKRQLIWPDGGTMAADVVVAKPEALLVRIR